MDKLLPEVLSVQRSELGDGAVILQLHILSDIAHFSGHFPGLPVLPGVVQIDWAARLARVHLSVTGEFCLMENIKFQTLVLPDMRLALALKWTDSDKRLDFAFSNSERKYSSGRIVFGACR